MKLNLMLYSFVISLFAGILYTILPMNILDAMLDVIGGGLFAMIGEVVGIDTTTLFARRIFGAISLITAGFVGMTYVDEIGDESSMMLLMRIGIGFGILDMIAWIADKTQYLDWDGWF